MATKAAASKAAAAKAHHNGPTTSTTSSSASAVATASILNPLSNPLVSPALNPVLNPLTQPLNSPALVQYVPPRLVIVKQSSLAEETVTTKDGDLITVHIVVKHSPFLIQLGLASTPTTSMYPQPPLLDLNRLTFEARLLYDNGQEKEVDFVKLKPLEYKVRVNDSGSKVNVECRLKVLSSQLEDMNFRIKFIALDPITQKEICPLLTTISDPIKVISKPEQIRKKKVSKKTISDSVMDDLARIDQQHATQSALLNKLASMIESDSTFVCQLCRQGYNLNNINTLSSMNSLNNLNNMNTMNTMNSLSNSHHDSHHRLTTSSSSVSTTTNSGTSEPPAKRLKTEDYSSLDFEAVFYQLMEAYENLKPEERIEKMRLAIIGTGLPSEYFSELLDLFSAEGLQKEIGSEATHESLFNTMEECDCPACPHKLELKRIEDFYKEVFSM
eukprot:TRINITY_DN4669_c0_g2_i1.p1 TRINITY_DN4669_c0_g2~~TRINITY_DN4669_c0_g2_i1.p1  ORF type:complete len:443 (+),score=97.57 TRINITY_DN4669_c0_g2_i1:164-1492(+)